MYARGIVYLVLDGLEVVGVEVDEGRRGTFPPGVGARARRLGGGQRTENFTMTPCPSNEPKRHAVRS